MKLHFVIFVALIFFANEQITLGQRKSRSTKKPVLTETEATTKDGRKVILRSDGTWSFAKLSDPTPSTNQRAETTSIYIDLNLPKSFDESFYYLAYFSAKVDLYLISEELESLIATPLLLEIYDKELEKNHPALSGRSNKPTTNYLFLTMRLYKSLYPIYSNEASKAFSAAKKYSRDIYMPKLENKIIFDDVPRGKYFLIGFAESLDKVNHKMWNIEVNLNSPILTLTLDEKNDVE